MKVPAITAIRITILVASFAFIFTFILMLLVSLGFCSLASARPSQVPLLKQPAYQTSRERSIACGLEKLAQTPRIRAFPARLGPILALRRLPHSSTNVCG